jgi:hypothetical protein
MKSRGDSNLCLAGALVLGLIVAWGAIAPLRISGEHLTGAGGCCCSGHKSDANDCTGRLCVTECLRCKNYPPSSKLYEDRGAVCDDGWPCYNQCQLQGCNTTKTCF